MLKLNRKYLNLVAAFALILSSCNDGTNNKETSELGQTPVQLVGEENADPLLIVANTTDDEAAKMEKAQKDLESVNMALGDEWDPGTSVAWGMASTSAIALIVARGETIASGLNRFAGLFENSKILKGAALSAQVEIDHVADLVSLQEAVRAELIAQQEAARNAEQVGKVIGFEHVQDDLSLAAKDARRAHLDARSELKNAETALNRANQAISAQERIISELEVEINSSSQKINTLFEEAAQKWSRTLGGGIARFARSKMTLRGIQAVGILASGALLITCVSSYAHVQSLEGQKAELVKLINPKTKEVIAEEKISVSLESSAVSESSNDSTAKEESPLPKLLESIHSTNARIAK